MTVLFGVDLPSIIHGALSNKLQTFELIRTTYQRDLNDPTHTVLTKVSYEGEGIISDYQNSLIGNTNIVEGDRETLLIAESLPSPPVIGDFIIFDTIRYNIISIKTDPAQATYTCQIRR